MAAAILAGCLVGFLLAFILALRALCAFARQIDYNTERRRRRSELLFLFGGLARVFDDLGTAHLHAQLELNEFDRFEATSRAGETDR